MIEKIFFEISEVKSVTKEILIFTFLIEVAVSSAISAKATRFAPVTPLVRLVLTLPLIRPRSIPSVKSKVLSAFALTLITSTTAFNAVLNASEWLAPEPSTAAAKAFTTVKNCLLAFSTASASTALASAAKALKVK